MNEWQTALEVDAEALTARCDPASLPPARPTPH